jgi:hypothetical protein
MQAQPLQQQPLAWWQPLLLLLLKPLTACWKVREVVLEVVLQVVLAVPALVVTFPVLFMWLIVHVAIKMHRWQHRHQPLSALFLFKVVVFPVWFYPLFLLVGVVALVKGCFECLSALGGVLLPPCQQIAAAAVQWFTARILLRNLLLPFWFYPLWVLLVVVAFPFWFYPLWRLLLVLVALAGVVALAKCCLEYLAALGRVMWPPCQQRVLAVLEWLVPDPTRL